MRSILVFALAAVAAPAQYSEPAPNRSYGVNVDQYVGSWKHSEPNVTHGVLIERAILKGGDPNQPGPPGQVLEYHKQISLASLEPLARTQAAHHPEQEILYIECGAGRLQSGDLGWELREGVTALIPPDIEHILVNTGDKPLELLLLSGVPDSSAPPRKDILVRDRRQLPYAEAMGHWNYNAKLLFGPKDGLHANEKVLLVTMEPMTIGGPHPHVPHWEEVWLKLPPESSYAFLGSEVRVQEPNEAFLVPPNGQTVHSVVNLSRQPMHWFYFGHYTQPVTYPDWVWQQPSVRASSGWNGK